MIKRVLFFGNYPNPMSPTLNVFFQKLIYEFADLGISCTVIDPVSITKYKKSIRRIPYKRTEYTSKGNAITVISPRFISITSKKIGKIDLHVFSVAMARRAATREARKLKGNFDATYGHFINVAGVCACRIGYEFSKPRFVANGESNLNPTTYNYTSPYKIKDFQHCTGVISVSGKNADELKGLKLIEDEIIKVFPNGVDHSLFFQHNKEEARRKYGFNPEDLIAIFVGSFSNRKGYLRVLEASKNITNLKLVFVGEGAEIPHEDRILLCHRVSHDELPELLSACDFFVLPTLNEGCCNAIIEALACGLPVVSSNLPFNDEILNDSNSIRVDPMNIEELNEAMNVLTQNKEVRNELSRGALVSSKQFDVSQRAQRILSFMEERASDLLK